MSKRARGWFSIAMGASATILLLLMAYYDSRDPAPRFPLPSLVVVGFAAVVLVAGGVSLLLTAGRVAAGEPEEPVSYRHTYRLFGLLGFGLLAALVARGYAVPSDFGKYGNYRGGAPAEAAVARAPRYQGARVCSECHEVESAAHTKDVHRTVQCEVCHGPGDKHAEDPANEHLAVKKDKDWCLVCHRKLTARPGAFPQVSWREHYTFVGVSDERIDCIKCHDPHEPLYLQKPVAEARLHPLIHRCRDCHVGRTDETLARPAAHPSIFDCSYCHKAIAKDFADRTHHEVQCTTCHLFLKESDFAGRIVRNTDPRFCLLCHRTADYRGKSAAAPIDWAQHLASYGDTTEESTPCTSCHVEEIHGDLTRIVR